jgi:L-serine dehydratase
MAVSIFQLFSIGVGPSSSHTVGPMRAARQFLSELQAEGELGRVERLTIELYGSLAMTGKGHATDVALLLGLEGETPDNADPDTIPQRVAQIEKSGWIKLLGRHRISFDVPEDLIFHKGKRLPFHSNAIRFKVYDGSEREFASQIYYSVGGGFIVTHEEAHDPFSSSPADVPVPYAFKTCEELFQHCKNHNLKIHELMMENEKAFRSEEEVRSGILKIWQVMQASVERGCQQEGILPGGLNVKRRAAGILKQLQAKNGGGIGDPSEIFDWVSLFALAVNEENAAGGRVVTAPTNGASGIIPAVLHYYQRFTQNPTEDGIIRFFLTAGAIGILYKEGASLSAAEMGCQGEVGVACSMAAGGLACALEASDEQIENAAEIGMEHNLGLTCDPIAGLVQIPCIERNTMGAIKAINACRLAMYGDGQHRVSLDQVIMTMRKTGEDMKHVYKETAEGGLALYVPVSVPEC